MTLVLLGLGLTGCGASVYQLRFGAEDQVEPVQMTALPHARVAVVFQAPEFLARYEVKGDDGHRYVLEGTQGYVADLFQAMFRSRFATLDSAVDRTPSGYDVYVYPSLRLRIGGKDEKRCTAEATVTVVDATGRRFQRSAQGEYTFKRGDFAGQACKTAIMLASTGPMSRAMDDMAVSRGKGSRTEQP